MTALLRPANELAEEALAAWRKHSSLADQCDWDGDYAGADFHRKVAALCKDDAEHYSERGEELVPLF